MVKGYRKNKHDSIWAEEVCLRILESHAPAVAVTCLVSIPTHAVLRSLPSSAASGEGAKSLVSML